MSPTIIIDSSDDRTRTHDQWTDLLGEIFDGLETIGITRDDVDEYDEGIRFSSDSLEAVRGIVAGRCYVGIA